MRPWVNALIFSIAIVLSAILLSAAWKQSHATKDDITVTGLATQDFTSDLIVWNGEFTERDMVLKNAYEKLKQDADTVRRYLLKKGVAPAEIIFSAVDIRKQEKKVYSNDGNSFQNVFDGYQLTERVTIQSKQVDTVEHLSREITELINSGVEFYSDPPSYYYTKLSELKLSLLAAATADARERAEKIAQNAHAALRKLRDGYMGVFQITGQNSNEEFSGGGSFNTSSKAKTASITAHLEFEVD